MIDRGCPLRIFWQDKYWCSFYSYYLGKAITPECPETKLLCELDKTEEQLKRKVGKITWQHFLGNKTWEEKKKNILKKGEK
jgi:hypothetical protein